MSFDEMIVAAIRQMNSDDIFKTYLKLSECLFRAIEDKEKENRVTIGCERPGVKLEVTITLEESEAE